jgi:hypothetical protein
MGETNKMGKTGAARADLPTYEQIAARAYQIYLERGCQHGHDLDDWLQAEYELLQLPVDKLAKMKAAPVKTVRRSVVQVVRSAMC